MEAAKTRQELSQVTAEISGSAKKEESKQDVDIFEFMGGSTLPSGMTMQPQTASAQKEQKDEFDMLFS